MTRTTFIFVILLSLIACQGQASNGEPVQHSDTTAPKEPAPEAVVTDEMIEAEREAQFAIEMAEEEFGLYLQERLGSGSLLSADWIEKEGSRICSGYLTRFADNDFCAAEIPPDWVPFEFNGETYFVQPLSEVSE